MLREMKDNEKRSRMRMSRKEEQQRSLGALELATVVTTNANKSGARGNAPDSFGRKALLGRKKKVDLDEENMKGKVASKISPVLPSSFKKKIDADLLPCKSHWLKFSSQTRFLMQSKCAHCTSKNQSLLTQERSLYNASVHSLHTASQDDVTAHTTREVKP